MKIKLTDIATTGGTEGQIPKINSSGDLEYQDDGGSGGGTVFGLECGDASNTGTPDYVIDGGSA